MTNPRDPTGGGNWSGPGSPDPMSLLWTMSHQMARVEAMQAGNRQAMIERTDMLASHIDQRIGDLRTDLAARIEGQRVQTKERFDRQWTEIGKNTADIAALKARAPRNGRPGITIPWSVLGKMGKGLISILGWFGLLVLGWLGFSTGS